MTISGIGRVIEARISMSVLAHNQAAWACMLGKIVSAALVTISITCWKRDRGEISVLVLAHNQAAWASVQWRKR